MSYLDKINSPSDLKKMNINSMNFLCAEIRNFLIDSISVTGGHLASNLGVVELTTALHYCFNSPEDKIIWDVGHQAYVHKILTGRKKEFPSLRKENGLSGFPKGNESPHDAFDVGHSSTSVSVALGYCVSRELEHKNYSVVAVIGDGSTTGGLAFEALNNAGRLDSNIIVILNDNQMSISENVGALSKKLSQLRSAPSYLGAKEDIHKILDTVPVLGKPIDKAIEKTKDVIKHVLVPNALFEEFGFNYYGPIDGHNLDELIKVIKKVKKINKPILLHVYTKKGKGYEQAEERPSVFHGVDSFCIDTGLPLKSKCEASYSDVFGTELVKIAGTNRNILAITAAMSEGTGLSSFAEKFPKRLFDVGIAEAHAVTFAAGLAKTGKIPVFAVYSTFLQRSYDQILHDVCIQNLHVVFAIDRAGIVGADGETHQGIFDISFLSHIPNMTIMAAKNKNELKTMLKFAIDFNAPIALRYPRGTASLTFDDFNSIVEYGKSELIYQGKDIILLFLGAVAETVFEVYRKLKEKNINITVVNIRFAKPIDLEMVKSLKNYKYIYTFEDAINSGGVGSIILNEANNLKVPINNFYSFSFPDEFILQGTREQIFKRYNLDAESIFNKIYGDFGTRSYH